MTTTNNLIKLALPVALTTLPLISLILTSTVITYTSLPQTTKSQIRTAFLLHAALAVACLSVTTHYTLHYLDISYRSWALTHGLPVAIDSSPWQWPWYSDAQVATWLSHVSLFHDAWELTTEAPARTCWVLLVILSMMAWSVYVAKEAQRRSIPNGWAYVVLALLLSTSFSMNLFYIAVLTHPAPKEKESQPQKSESEPESENIDIFGIQPIPDSEPTTPPSPDTTLLTPPRELYTTILPLTFIATMVLLTSASTSRTTSPSKPSPLLPSSSSPSTPEFEFTPTKLPFLPTLLLQHALLTLPSLLTPVLSSILSSISAKAETKSKFLNPHTPKTYRAFFRAQFELILLFGTLMLGAMLFIAGGAVNWDGRHVTRHGNVYVYCYGDRAGKEAKDSEAETEKLLGILLRSGYDHPVVARVVGDAVGIVVGVVVWSWGIGVGANADDSDSGVGADKKKE